MVSVSYEEFSLANGLNVIIHEDHTTPIAAINVWYHVGSKNEDPGRTGFAHLFEHVMFEGSKHHNHGYFEPLQRVGAVLNGSTTPDRTNYWENVPSNYLELALWLQSDRMGFLLEALDQQRFDVQRDVVKNERRQSYENRPYGMTHLTLQPIVFPTPHPYSWPTIGSQKDLDSADLEDVKAFFKHYYSPSNASIAIVGDVVTSDVIRLVEKYFGDIPPGPTINRIGRMDSNLKGRVSLTMMDKVQLKRLNLVWPTVPMFDENEAALSVLGVILGDGKSSRLNQLLVHEKQIAHDVHVFNHPQEIAGEFHIQVTANPGQSLEEIEDLVFKELGKLRKEEPRDEELNRAKNRIESSHVSQLEKFGGFGGRADLLNEYKTFAGNTDLINSDLGRYTSITSQDISKAASLELGEDYVRLSVIPEEPRKSVATSLDRSKMPRPPQSPLFNPPIPIRRSLSNGLTVLLIEKQGLPMVSMGLICQSGAITDPPSKPGISSLTASMILEGTATRSSADISSQMEYLGSHLSSHASREYSSISTQTLKTHWSTALEILSDVSRNATFPKEDLERIRKEHLIELTRISDNPNSISARVSRAIQYGPKSVYGHPLIGTTESIQKLTQSELLMHFQHSYVPKNSTLIIVGDVVEEEAMDQCSKFFGDWIAPKTASSTDHHQKADCRYQGSSIFLADKPGAAQSIINAGHLTIPRNHPDFYKLTLLNYILGGQFTARLNSNLRQDKGYSYGYTSSVDWCLKPSLLTAGGSVHTAVTSEAIKETIKEFNEIRGIRPITSKEFNDAKLGILRGIPSRFETQSQTLGQLAQLVVFNLEDDYLESYSSEIDAVTKDEVHSLAQSILDEKLLKILVVGDRITIEPKLKELGFPIFQVDYEGNLL